jgi:hypothetical protein
MHAHDVHAHGKGCQMRHRATFLAGLAIGLVAGARAGRERYEQLKKASQKVVDSPSVRKATRTVGQKAGELTKAASHQAAERLPKLTETAKHSAGKVRSQLTRNHDNGHGAEEHATVNGTRPPG